MILAYFRFALPAAQSVSKEMKHNIEVVYDTIHNSGHNESSHHIKQRVLLDQYSRQNDRNTEDQRTDADTLIFL